MQRHQALDSSHVTTQVLREFVNRRRQILILTQVPRCPQARIDVFDDMNRKAHCVRLIHDGTLYGLPNPPGRVGRKTKAAFGIKLLHRVDQPEVALFDQVE